MNKQLREIVATAQTHGGTRVIELTTFAVTDKHITQWRIKLNAYDSQRPHEQRPLALYSLDQMEDLDRAREDGRSALRPSETGEDCNCWGGWDPYCGEPGCWGVYISTSVA